MRIIVELPEDPVGACPFWEKTNGKLDKMGLKTFSNNPLITIQNNNGFVYVDIDERYVRTVEPPIR